MNSQEKKNISYSKQYIPKNMFSTVKNSISLHWTFVLFSFSLSLEFFIFFK